MALHMLVQPGVDISAAVTFWQFRFIDQTGKQLIFQIVLLILLGSALAIKWVEIIRELPIM